MTFKLFLGAVVCPCLVRASPGCLRSCCHKTMRPLISYDDITLPYDDAQNALPIRHSPPIKPPSKKQKRNHRNWKHQNRGQSEDYLVQNGDSTAYTDGEEDENMSESRELTHEDIWDDTALIDAWNAASEEYEVP